MDNNRFHKRSSGASWCARAGKVSPPLTFSWVRDGQTLIESMEVSVRRFDEFSSSITISALREDHSGNYTCIVSNQGGSDSSTVKLRVLVPPTWLRQPYDMSVLSGARVTLNCETAGTPKPTVTWRRSKADGNTDSDSVANREDGSLTTSESRKKTRDSTRVKWPMESGKD
ncbi:down syndrome cell adhesion molecule-like protein Dscam2 [Caerostris extrusa]|uniref:Down syndrome cell adhesion molecule-like protein Dscam2 n=1 Tax=Caerostris extrusa TaxID=172846 RepID=A0AAV4RTZ7_CAEEX|nr:down syndrome cell adhesion molecule-like protein Dscam2 [Caerostris extrusa]